MTPIKTANRNWMLLIWIASRKLNDVVADVGFLVCSSRRCSRSFTFCLSASNCFLISSRSDLLLLSSFSNRCSSFFAACIAWFWYFHFSSYDLMVASAWFNCAWSSSYIRMSSIHAILSHPSCKDYCTLFLNRSSLNTLSKSVIVSLIVFSSFSTCLDFSISD